MRNQNANDLPARDSADQAEAIVSRHAISREHGLYDVSSRPLTALDCWRVVSGKKAIVAGVALLLGMAAFLLSARQAPEYRAVATLEIGQINENFLNFKDVSPTAGSSLAETFIRTQTEILRSRALAARVVDELELTQRPQFHSRPGLLTASLVQLGLKGEPSSTPEELARAWVSQHLTVRHSLETNIVELMFEARDPRLAADVLNALADNFIEQNLEVRWQATQDTSEWLMGHLEELRTKLRGSEEELVAYARQEGLLYTQEEHSVSEERLRQLQAQRTEAQQDRIHKQSQYERSQASPADSLPAVLEDRTLQAHVAKLAELRGRLAELRTSFKGTYYKVQRAEAETAQLEAALETEKQNILLRIENEYEAAKRREALLEDSYRSQARLVADEAVRGIHYDILRRGVDSTRTLYEAMLQKMKEASIASALRANNVRVVDPAEPPRQPFKPIPLFNAAMGILCGVFLGTGWILTREMTDRSLRLPADLVRHLNVRLLGEIPSRHLDPAQPKPHRRYFMRLMRTFGLQARVIDKGRAYGTPDAASSDEVDEATLVFLGAWRQHYGDRSVGIVDLWNLATTETAGVVDLGRDAVWRRKARLGRWINSLRNRRYVLDDGCAVRVRSCAGSGNTRRWRLSAVLMTGRHDSKGYEGRHATSGAYNEHDRPSYLRAKRIVVRYTYRSRRSRPHSGTRGSSGPGSDRLELTTWHQSSTLLAEAFHNTATSIQLCGGSQHPRTIVLTSPNPMEGKTTVSCNLAIALADRGARVLLIDADLRQPRLHDVFDVSNQAGLCTFLKAKKPVSGQSLRGFAMKTRIPSLYLLPSGACETSVPNLLSSGRLSQVLECARAEFDMVLVDTPPMLHLTDARILGKVVDGVVMVVRARKTNSDHAARAMRSFQHDGTHVLGAILNDFDVREIGDWYIYRDYYDYAARTGSSAVS